MTERAATTSFDPRIVLRPRTLDETLDLALAYLRTSFRDFAKLAAILTAVSGAVTFALVFAFGLTHELQQFAVAIVVAPIVERVVTVYGGRHLFRNDPRIGPSTVAALKKLPLAVVSAAIATAPWTPMLLTRFDDSTWIGVGVMLASLWPFIIAPHAYLGEAVHLEQLPLGRAAKRSRVLVTYRFGRALGLVIVTALVRVLVAAAASLTTQFVLGFVLQFKDVSDALGGWPAMFGWFLAGPYLAMVRMFDYVDARTRREGWDIQVRFNAIAQRTREEEERRLAG